MSKTTHRKASKAKGTSKGASKGASRSGSKAATGKAKAPARKAGVKASSNDKAGTVARKAARPSPAESVRSAGGGLTVGSKVPAFNLRRDGGATVSLDSFAGRKLVLFFYPRAGTPGCTREAMDFSRLSGKFAALDTAVVGVSADPPRAQETFRDKHDLTVPLLSDETHAMLERFGVWGDKSLYGKVFQGVVRTTVLIGPDARVIHVWRNVKVDGHAEAVLKHIENL